MNRIPREIDELMWTLAEVPNDAALDDFAQRYPEFKAEMARRLRALRALRTARPTVPAGTFVPGPGGRVPTGGRRWVPVAATLILACIALGAAMVAGVKAAQAPHKSHDQSAACESEEAQTPQDPNSSPRGGGLLPGQGGTEIQELPESTEPALRAERAPGALERLIVLRTERASLRSVIEEIGRQAEVEVIFAPGFEDETVEARFEGVRAMDALRNLGQNFGFTPLEAGSASILIVPELDRTREAPSLGGAGTSGPAR